MNTTFIIAVVALASAVGGMATALGSDASASSQPMDSVMLETLGSDLVRPEDGGIKARAAADQAVKIGRPDLLLLGLKNRLYDVRIYSVEALSRCSVYDQVFVLNQALKDRLLWVREAKVGELIVSQERFLNAMRSVIQKMLDQPKSDANLLDPQVRERLASELRSVLVAKVRQDMARFDDGGQAARSACDAAVKLQDVDLLLGGVTNRLYDAKLHCVKSLARFGRPQQLAALSQILRDETLWVKEQKVGELIVSQERFAAEIQSMSAKLLQQDLHGVDLFDAKARSRVSAELASK